MTASKKFAKRENLLILTPNKGTPIHKAINITGILYIILVKNIKWNLELAQLIHVVKNENQEEEQEKEGDEDKEEEEEEQPNRIKMEK